MYHESERVKASGSEEDFERGKEESTEVRRRDRRNSRERDVLGRGRPLQRDSDRGDRSDRRSRRESEGRKQVRRNEEDRTGDEMEGEEPTEPWKRGRSEDRMEESDDGRKGQARMVVKLVLSFVCI